jgi:hypothetical protein
MGDEPRGEQLQRRGLLAGAAALVAGMLAKLGSPGPAEAGHDGTNVFHLGNLTNVFGAARLTGTAPGIPVMRVRNTDYDAIRAEVGPSGPSDSAAVYGVNEGTGYGLWGATLATATALPRAGVYGSGLEHFGVLGTSSTRAGVMGRTSNAVNPTNPSSGGPLIAGVVGAGNDRPGIAARSESQSAIYAVCMAPAGPGAFECIAPNTYAVVATSTNYSGVVGTTRGAGYGVAGVAAGASSTAAVFGRVDPPAGAGVYAGLFQGNVLVTGNLTVLGSLNRAAPNPQADGGYSRAYAMESSQGWAEEFGEARLVDGRAVVPLPAALARVADTTRYHVFLTPHDVETETLAVTARHRDHFEVGEHGKGASTATFSYRIVASRRGAAEASGDRVVVPQPVELPVRGPLQAEPAPPQPPERLDRPAPPGR